MTTTTFDRVRNPRFYHALQPYTVTSRVVSQSPKTWELVDPDGVVRGRIVDTPDHDASAYSRRTYYLPRRA